MMTQTELETAFAALWAGACSVRDLRMRMHDAGICVCETAQVDKLPEMRRILRIVGFPARGTAEEHVCIQTAANMVQATFKTAEELE